MNCNGPSPANTNLSSQPTFQVSPSQFCDFAGRHQSPTNDCFHPGFGVHLRGASINYYKEHGVPVPDVYEAQKVFYRDEKSIVDGMRVKLWPNKKNPAKPVHPDRWTGNPSLYEDIVKADQLYGSSIKADLGSTLTEYYRTEYRKMNWRIHSGVASFWNQPPAAFNLVCGFAFKWCSDFGMLCTKIVLKDFGFNVVLEGLTQEWENIKQQQDLTYLRELDNFHTGE